MKIADKAKEKPKEFYSYVNDKKVVSTHTGPLISTNGQFGHSNEGICDTINSYYLRQGGYVIAGVYLFVSKITPKLQD